MKACVVIRALNERLCDKSLMLASGLGFDQKLLWNTSALGYLTQLFTLGYDWVVSMDEDVFIWDCKAVLELIEYMKAENYVCCGVSEGVRKCNPVVVNPFFTIINVGAMRDSFDLEKIRQCKITDEMKEGVPEHMKRDDSSYVTFEGYYSLFYWILKQGRMLYLDCERVPEIDPVRKWAMVVRNHLDVEFMVHCWWSREYYKDPKRFEKIERYAEGRKEVTDDSDGRSDG